MIRATIGILASQGGFVGLLDTYSGAAAAYSLRLLRSTYTGSAIRVRRASDNTEQDIGFVNNELDTSTLTSFCSGTNGFVKTWYDQSGNANDASNTTASQQPQIVSSGSVIIINSKPAVQFNNANRNNLDVSSNFWTYTGDSTVFHTSRNRNSGSNQYGSVISYYEAAYQSLGLQWQQFPNTTTQATTDIYAPGGMATSGTQSVNTQYLVTFQWQNWSTHKTNGDTIIAINGVNQSLTAYGSNPSSWANNGVTKIGTFDGQPSGSFLGDIQEIVIYTSALSSADINGAEQNINDFYSIY